MATQRDQVPRRRKQVRRPNGARRARPTSEVAGGSLPAWVPAAGGGAAAVLLGVLVLLWPRGNPVGSEVADAPVDTASAAVAAAPTTVMRPVLQTGSGGVERRTAEVGRADRVEPPVEAPKPPVSRDQKPVIAPKPPREIFLAEATDAAPPEAALVEARPLPEFATRADREKFAFHLREMLYEGFRRGRDGFASAQEHYQSARALSAAEPRLDYGFGLILWKNVRYDDALARFEEAVHAESAGYWPAWQTLIRLQLARRNADDALTRFVDLARALRRESTGSAGADSVACAGWMGRLMAFLEQPESDVRADAQAVSHCGRTAEELLASNLLLLNAYRDGKAALNEDYQAGVSSAEESLGELQARLEAETALELKQIEEDKERQKDQLEKLEMSAAQWKEWIDKETRKYDEQLKKLGTAYQELQIELRQLTSTMLALSQEIAAIQARDIDRNGERPIVSSRAMGANIVLDQLQTRYTILERRAAAVHRQGSEVAAARQAAVARYQKATGKLVDQGDSLRKWNDVLANKEQAARKQGEKSTPEARIVKRQAHALSTYVPFDPEQEKQRILDSLPE